MIVNFTKLEDTEFQKFLIEQIKIGLEAKGFDSIDKIELTFRARKLEKEYY